MFNVLETMLRVCMRYGIGVRLMAMASVFEALVTCSYIVRSTHTDCPDKDVLLCFTNEESNSEWKKNGGQKVRVHFASLRQTQIDRQTMRS